MPKLNPEELRKVQLKLSKLMALSASPNEAEASLALEKCNELMEKYGISCIDVDQETMTVSTDAIFVQGYSKNMPKWIGMLASRSAGIFSTMVISRRDRDGKSWGGFSFVGGTSDVKIVTDLFIRLRRTISQMGKAYSENQLHPVVGAKIAYCTGVTITVCGRLERAFRTTETGLVLVKKKEIDKHVQSLFGNNLKTRAVQPTPPKDIYAMQAGLRDGEKVALHRSVEKQHEKYVDVCAP